jgi:Na+-transporting NADH:ubiquinone oxidoreductase subunit NqrC
MSEHSTSFVRSHPPAINYVLLLVVIIVGVAAGNLLSTYITAQAARQGLQAQSQRTQAHLQAAAQRQAADLADLAEHQQQQRRTDAVGAKLARSCADWQQADVSLHTDTTRTESARQCARFDRYVQTGHQADLK